MNRQQRTTFLRQRLQPDQPSLLSDMLWVVSGVTGTFIQLQVYGSFDGVVTGVTPEMILEPGGLSPIGFSFAGPPAPGLYGLLTLEFSEAVPDVFVLTSQQRSRCLRNAFGGLLAPGKGVWPSPAVTPTAVNAFYFSHIDTALVLNAATSLGPVVGSQELFIKQQSTGDDCQLATVQAGQLTFVAPVNPWASGDRAILLAATDLVIDQLGGKLQPFDILIP